MAHPRNERYAGPGRRPFPPRDDHDDRMYDDQSRSRSPAEMRNQGRARSPHRRPADSRMEYSRDREPGQGYQGHDRDDYRRRDSRPSPRRGRNTYKDRDREGYRSGSYSRSRSRSPRRGQSHFGQVSREVMMDGLPVDMTEEHISAELSNAYHIDGLDDIRVIRDRQTKLSRQLGFLRFSTIEASRAFLEQNHPSIYLYGPSAGSHDRSTKVRIAYSREREDRARAKGAGDWSCRKCFIVNFSTRPHCFKCGSPRPDMDPTGPPGVPAPKVANDGDNDAAPENQPSQFLLVRGLEASVSEELLAKGVAKLYRPPGNNESAPSNQKKGSKVASTTGDSNLGAQEGSLRRVLLVRDRRTNDSWRYGFAEFAGIKDAQAAMARLKSFDKFTISSKPVLVTYIHGGVFVPVINPSSGTSHYTFTPANNPSLQLMYWDDAAYVTELRLSTDEGESAQERKGDKAASNQQDTQAKGMKDSDKVKKRKADATTNTNPKKLAMPSQLQFWSERHAELHGINKSDGENRAETGSELDTSRIEPAAPQVQSYADLNINFCYLCWCIFDNAEHVKYHESVSEIHRENMQNEEARERAMGELIKHGVVEAPQNYRDRARERRAAFRPDNNASAPSAPSVTSYADFNELCCLLCWRKFERPELLIIHERHNQIHQENMQNEAARADGDCRLIESGLAPLPTPIYRAFAEYPEHENPSVEPTTSYADLKQKCCLLCEREFSRPEEVLRHELVSELHRENLKNKELRAYSDFRLIEHGLAPVPTANYRFSAKDLECDDSSAQPVSSYADLEAKCCLLCLREFEKPEELLLHEAVSKMHRENLKSTELRERAMCDLVKCGVVKIPHIYGDRRKEQREAFASATTAPSDASYADLKRKSCYLCWRDLETPEDVICHERISELHQRNLKDEKLRAQGWRELIAHGVLEEPGSDEDDANERDQMPGTDSSARPTPSKPEEEDQRPVQTSSIGASLLRKMGWSEGSGLGAEGAGVTAPISTDVYAPGVGLGAQGGRLGDATEEAGRNTRGRYDEFLAKTKDNARQRYEEMDRS